MPASEPGKLFAGPYALYAGLVVIGVNGVLLSRRASITC